MVCHACFDAPCQFKATSWEGVARGASKTPVYDPTRLRAAVADVVRKQIDLGIDIVDDGEFGKPSFVSYVNERLGGFAFDREAPRQNP